jgi:RNA polymerase sigma-70 factor (ECF subfamily)
MKDAPDVTRLLHRWRAGDQDAADRLVAATYQELRRVARGFFRHERGNHTLQPTALVHDAFLRLFRDQPIDVQSREAFFRLIAAQMRRQLIDHARRRNAVKRGGGQPKLNVDELADQIPALIQESPEESFQRMEDAVVRLAIDHPRPAKVVQLRFFADMSNEAIAKELDLSIGTVKRDFAFARAWLARELKVADNLE